MVTDKQRRLIKWLVKLGIWNISIQMRLPDIHTKRGTYWFKKYLLKKQTIDNLHHAPCCPANHFHNTRFVFQHCTCGANRRRWPTESNSYLENGSPTSGTIKVNNQ